MYNSWRFWELRTPDWRATVPQVPVRSSSGISLCINVFIFNKEDICYILLYLFLYYLHIYYIIYIYISLPYYYIVALWVQNYYIKFLKYPEKPVLLAKFSKVLNKLLQSWNIWGWNGLCKPLLGWAFFRFYFERKHIVPWYLLLDLLILLIKLTYTG